MDAIDAIGIVLIILTLILMLVPIYYIYYAFREGAPELAIFEIAFSFVLLGLYYAIYGKLIKKSIQYIQTQKTTVY